MNGIDLVVIGSDRPLVLDFDTLERRSSGLWVRTDLARIGVGSSFDLAAMLQTGGTALSEVVRGARVNTDDNGLVEFAAPKTLYLDSQDANMRMLQGPGDDPLAVVASLVRTGENPDRLRLEMIRRWVRREQKSRALRAAAFFTDRALKAQADELLRTAR